MDPEFTTHLAIAQVWGSTAFLLAETPVLPINCSDYAVALNKGVLDIHKKYGSALAQKGISLGRYMRLMVGYVILHPIGTSVTGLLVVKFDMNTYM